MATQCANKDPGFEKKERKVHTSKPRVPKPCHAAAPPTFATSSSFSYVVCSCLISLARTELSVLLADAGLLLLLWKAAFACKQCSTPRAPLTAGTSCCVAGIGLAAEFAVAAIKQLLLLWDQVMHAPSYHGLLWLCSHFCAWRHAARLIALPSLVMHRLLLIQMLFLTHRQPTSIGTFTCQLPMAIHKLQAGMLITRICRWKHNQSNRCPTCFPLVATSRSRHLVKLSAGVLLS